MFEDQPATTTPSAAPLTPQSPLNPVMPPPGMTPPPGGNLPPLTPPPTGPSVHSMPERFRATAGGPKSGSGTTKKLVIILVVVVAVAGLGFGGLYVFQNVLNKNNANNSNLVVTNRTNLNTTANLNTTVNLNQNSNSNLNSNVDQNANTNVDTTNTNTTVNTNTTTNTNSPVVTGPLPSSTDTDSDGLTDVEEAVYTTNANKADTDGDGFIDGKQIRSDGTIVGELYLGYNPAGAGPLEGSSLVKRQEDANKAYSLLVPTSWTVTAGQDGGMLITPTQQTGEFFQVTVNDNPNRLDAKTWYQTNNPSTDVSKLTTFAVNGLSGVYSEDLSTAYIVKDTKVYSIQYNTGALTQVNFRTTFDMMVRSFKLVAS